VFLVACAVAVAGGIAWWGLARTASDHSPPQNVLLITIDTLRADAVGAYGARSAATPWIDRIAAGGLRFDNAHAHTVVTLPSHANILMGRLPTEHGVRDNSGFRVAADQATLATQLKAAGFMTAAFVSAFPLDSRFGLARGFDVYDDRFVDATPRPPLLEQERAGTATVAAARRWLDAQGQSRRWFCWVHLYEPHFPYAPPEPFAARFAGTPYIGEVAAADAALGPLLRPILDAGASANTLVVLTADHGESLGEHEEATHGIFAYEATLRVPLLLYFPRLWPARAVSSAVGHIDIAPTILRTLGLPPAEALHGRILTEGGQKERGQPANGDDLTYFEALSGSLNRGWAPLKGVIANRMKYVDLPIPELYDLSSDPGERQNLASVQTETVRTLRERLQAFGSQPVSPRAETTEVRERLRSLGYLTGGASRTDKRVTEADDPKRLMRVDKELQEVAGLYLGGQASVALARCRALVTERPDMRVALLTLAHLEREAGNMEAAINALRRALAINPADPETAALLGAYLTGANRAIDAVELLQSYAKTADADIQVLVALALAQARANRPDDALGTIARARTQDPSNAMLLVHEGTIELMAGRRVEARRAFEGALASNPAVARAHSSLAAMATEEGRRDDALDHWRAAVALDADEYPKLLAMALSLGRSGRADEARPYLQMFADSAPPDRFAAEIARTREWLARMPVNRN
jgi:arylsulfatase A-like enzyme/tetratricopeptide (TPR) repeat protein